MGDPQVIGENEGERLIILAITKDLTPEGAGVGDVIVEIWLKAPNIQLTWHISSL